MKRLLALLAGLMLTWLAAPAVAGPTPSPIEVVHAYNYDSPADNSFDDTLASERGPPVVGYSTTATYTAVDAPLNGPSARPDDPTPHSYTTYDDSARLVQVAGATHTTNGRVEVVGGCPVDFERWPIAANGGARLGGRIVTEDALGDVAIRNAMRVKPEAGVFDVIGHGNPSSVSGMSAGELAGAIRARPGWGGQAIRLLSCSTGCPTGSFAQGLANELGVVVRAPSTDFFVSSRGGISFESGGGWRIFSPGG